MTLTDLLLWLGLAAAGIVSCTAIVGVIRWLYVRADARTYLVPVADRMVWLPPADDMLVEPAVECDEADNDAPAWALAALADARKEAENTYATLGEFAKPMPTAPALIWAELDGAARGRELWAQWRPDWIGAAA